MVSGFAPPHAGAILAAKYVDSALARFQHGVFPGGSHPCDLPEEPVNPLRYKYWPTRQCDPVRFGSPRVNMSPDNHEQQRQAIPH
jgi:hypothetical protein